MDNMLKSFLGIGDDEVQAARDMAAERDEEREARRAARQARKADPERQRKRKEFADRYRTGDPSEGFSGEEALEHIAEMRQEMTPAEFRKAMEQTIENLPPDKRDDFLAYMRKQKQAMNAGQAPSAAATSAAPAADAAAAQADPFAGLLSGLMGGSAAGSGGVDAGSVLDDLLKGGFKAPSSSGGGTPTEADFQALINSPLAKAVLGGLATYGMQAMQDDDDKAPRG